MIFAMIVGLILTLMIIGPFFVGEGGMLQAGSAIRDVAALEKQRLAVLNRYLVDEKAQTEELISKTEWAKKQQFLTNRYIDIARQIDFVKHDQN